MGEEGRQDRLLERVVAELRRPVMLSPGFEARVMAAVRAGRRPVRWRSALGWLVRPRWVAVTPLEAAGVAAAVAAVVLGGSLLVRSPAGPAPPGRPAEAGARPGSPARGSETEVIRFVLVAPGASRVALVGDFNDWDPRAMPLRPAGDGRLWTIDVRLRPGRHEYAFVVNGRQWRVDPTAPRAVANDFGPPNSVIIVGGQSL